MSNRRLETETLIETETEQDSYMGHDPAIVEAGEIMTEAYHKSKAPLSKEEKRERNRKRKERQAFERAHIHCFYCNEKYREHKLVKNKEGKTELVGVRTRKGTFGEFGNWHKSLPLNFKEPAYFCNRECFNLWDAEGRPRVESRRVGDETVGVDVHHEYLLPEVRRQYIDKVLRPAQILAEQRRVHRNQCEQVDQVLVSNGLEARWAPRWEAARKAEAS